MVRENLIFYGTEGVSENEDKNYYLCDKSIMEGILII